MATNAELYYRELTETMSMVEQGQMFGKPCVKVNGKAFACFFQDCMVFKLTAEAHTSATQLTGTQLFDPSGKGRPMKEWVQVPFEHAARWKEMAQQAFDYVKE